MPASRKRGKRNAHRRQLRDLETRLGPDGAEIVHTFPGGWTIRRIPPTVALKREGRLMHPCLARAQPLPPQPGEPVVHSLRDPDGYPHVTFWFHPETRAACDFSGHSD